MSASQLTRRSLERASHEIGPHVTQDVSTLARLHPCNRPMQTTRYPPLHHGPSDPDLV